MASDTTTQTAVSNRNALTPWQAGVVGGLLGSIAFGAIMVFVIPDPVLEVAIPSMYGIEATPDSPAEGAGWVIHLSHGAVLGVVFAAILSIGAVRTWVDTVLKTAIVGLVYGVVVWAALAVVVMPIWLDAVGFPGAPPLPNVAPLSLLGHALYGVVLGIAYAFLER
ncbi:histidine kinase [Natronosalvus vescus]|uniref:histidine kinase n=1 Tax=Natronosalvus vescus TaxID=2953881 RepID=UPI002091332E|nr:histidine kinase [Natronosalvus vescus]